MTFTQEKSGNENLVNITLYTRLRDGEVCAYIAEAKEGYVMYDANDIPTPSAEGETPQRHYHTRAIFPLSTDFDKLNWKAVRKEEVDCKSII